MGLYILCTGMYWSVWCVLQGCKESEEGSQMLTTIVSNAIGSFNKICSNPYVDPSSNNIPCSSKLYWTSASAYTLFSRLLSGIALNRGVADQRELRLALEGDGFLAITAFLYVSQKSSADESSSIRMKVPSINIPAEQSEKDLSDIATLRIARNNNQRTV